MPPKQRRRVARGRGRAAGVRSGRSATVPAVSRVAVIPTQPPQFSSNAVLEVHAHFPRLASSCSSLWRETRIRYPERYVLHSNDAYKAVCWGCFTLQSEAGGRLPPFGVQNLVSNRRTPTGHQYGVFDIIDCNKVDEALIKFNSTELAQREGPAHCDGRVCDVCYSLMENKGRKPSDGDNYWSMSWSARTFLCLMEVVDGCRPIEGSLYRFLPIEIARRWTLLYVIIAGEASVLSCDVFMSSLIGCLRRPVMMDDMASQLDQPCMWRCALCPRTCFPEEIKPLSCTLVDDFDPWTRVQSSIRDIIMPSAFKELDIQNYKPSYLKKLQKHYMAVDSEDINDDGRHRPDFNILRDDVLLSLQRKLLHASLMLVAGPRRSIGRKFARPVLQPWWRLNYKGPYDFIIQGSMWLEPGKGICVGVCWKCHKEPWRRALSPPIAVQGLVRPSFVLTDEITSDGSFRPPTHDSVPAGVIAIEDRSLLPVGAKIGEGGVYYRMYTRLMSGEMETSVMISSKLREPPIDDQNICSSMWGALLYKNRPELRKRLHHLFRKGNAFGNATLMDEWFDKVPGIEETAWLLEHPQSYWSEFAVFTWCSDSKIPHGFVNDVKDLILNKFGLNEMNNFLSSHIDDTAAGATNSAAMAGATSATTGTAGGVSSAHLTAAGSTTSATFTGAATGTAGGVSSAHLTAAGATTSATFTGATTGTAGGVSSAHLTAAGATTSATFTGATTDTAGGVSSAHLTAAGATTSATFTGATTDTAGGVSSAHLTAAGATTSAAMAGGLSSHLLFADDDLRECDEIERIERDHYLFHGNELDNVEDSFLDEQPMSLGLDVAQTISHDDSDDIRRGVPLHDSGKRYALYHASARMFRMRIADRLPKVVKEEIGRIIAVPEGGMSVRNMNNLLPMMLPVHYYKAHKPEELDQTHYLGSMPITLMTCDRAYQAGLFSPEDHFQQCISQLDGTLPFDHMSTLLFFHFLCLRRVEASRKTRSMTVKHGSKHGYSDNSKEGLAQWVAQAGRVDGVPLKDLIMDAQAAGYWRRRLEAFGMGSRGAVAFVTTTPCLRRAKGTWAIVERMNKGMEHLHCAPLVMHWMRTAKTLIRGTVDDSSVAGKITGYFARFENQEGLSSAQAAHLHGVLFDDPGNNFDITRAEHFEGRMEEFGRLAHTDVEEDFGDSRWSNRGNWMSKVLTHTQTKECMREGRECSHGMPNPVSCVAYCQFYQAKLPSDLHEIMLESATAERDHNGDVIMIKAMSPTRFRPRVKAGNSFISPYSKSIQEITESNGNLSAVGSPSALAQYIVGYVVKEGEGPKKAVTACDDHTIAYSPAASSQVSLSSIAETTIAQGVLGHGVCFTNMNAKTVPRHEPAGRPSHLKTRHSSGPGPLYGGASESDGTCPRRVELVTGFSCCEDNQPWDPQKTVYTRGKNDMLQMDEVTRYNLIDPRLACMRLPEYVIWVLRNATSKKKRQNDEHDHGDTYTPRGTIDRVQAVGKLSRYGFVDLLGCTIKFRKQAFETSMDQRLDENVQMTNRDRMKEIFAYASALELFGCIVDSIDTQSPHEVFTTLCNLRLGETRGNLNMFVDLNSIRLFPLYDYVCPSNVGASIRTSAMWRIPFLDEDWIRGLRPDQVEEYNRRVMNFMWPRVNTQQFTSVNPMPYPPLIDSGDPAWVANTFRRHVMTDMRYRGWKNNTYMNKLRNARDGLKKMHSMASGIERTGHLFSPLDLLGRDFSILERIASDAYERHVKAEEDYLREKTVDVMPGIRRLVAAVRHVVSVAGNSPSVSFDMLGPHLSEYWEACHTAEDPGTDASASINESALSEHLRLLRHNALSLAQMVRAKQIGLRYSGENMLHLGLPGSGKTSSALVVCGAALELGLRVLVTSHRCQRALDVGGVHTHRRFRIPGIPFSSPYSFSSGVIDKLQLDECLWRDIINADIIFIDEICETSDKLLILIHYICKRLRRVALPFGGIWIIGAGDHHQMPPVGQDLCLATDLVQQNFKTAVLSEPIRCKCDLLREFILGCQNPIRMDEGEMGQQHRSRLIGLLKQRVLGERSSRIAGAASATAAGATTSATFTGATTGTAGGVSSAHLTAAGATTSATFTGATTGTAGGVSSAHLTAAGATTSATFTGAATGTAGSVSSAHLTAAGATTSATFTGATTGTAGGVSSAHLTAAGATTSATFTGAATGTAGGVSSAHLTAAGATTSGGALTTRSSAGAASVVSRSATAYNFPLSVLLLDDNVVGNVICCMHERKHADMMVRTIAIARGLQEVAVKSEFEKSCGWLTGSTGFTRTTEKEHINMLIHETSNIWKTQRVFIGLGCIFCFRTKLKVVNTDVARKVEVTNGTMGAVISQGPNNCFYVGIYSTGDVVKVPLRMEVARIDRGGGLAVLRMRSCIIRNDVCSTIYGLQGRQVFKLCTEISTRSPPSLQALFTVITRVERLIDVHLLCVDEMLLNEILKTPPRNVRTAAWVESANILKETAAPFALPPDFSLAINVTGLDPLERGVVCCYVLKAGDGSDRGYWGSTVNSITRLNKHNGTTCGGAVATQHGRPFTYFLLIHGFRGFTIHERYERARTFEYDVREKILAYERTRGFGCTVVGEMARIACEEANTLESLQDYGELTCRIMRDGSVDELSSELYSARSSMGEDQGDAIDTLIETIRNVQLSGVTRSWWRDTAAGSTTSAAGVGGVSSSHLTASVAATSAATSITGAVFTPTVGGGSSATSTVLFGGSTAPVASHGPRQPTTLWGTHRTSSGGRGFGHIVHMVTLPPANPAPAHVPLAVLAADPNAMLCPWCHAGPIARDDGCAHMVCGRNSGGGHAVAAMCGRQFCAVTGRRLCSRVDQQHGNGDCCRLECNRLNSSGIMNAMGQPLTIGDYCDGNHHEDCHRNRGP